MGDQKKGVNRLDTSSTDAMHWAECFCEQFEGRSPDVDDMLGWFANYWATVYDPLHNEVEHLQGEKDSLEQSIHEAIYLILEEGSPIEAAQVLVNSAQADREPLRLSVSEDKAELLTSMGDKK